MPLFETLVGVLSVTPVPVSIVSILGIKSAGSVVLGRFELERSKDDVQFKLQTNRFNKTTLNQVITIKDAAFCSFSPGAASTMS